ncbi:hypothetical protein JW898_02575 [Candidatus Woesearchaeota archaeon]|nr:hypothetical protein [Candidatus Woesearchaeota archaeon]
MTYSSCCENENYCASQGSAGSGTGRDNPIRDAYGSSILQTSNSEHSWYQNGNSNPGYDAGINKVAGAYTSTPVCGRFEAANNLLL